MTKSSLFSSTLTTSALQAFLLSFFLFSFLFLPPVLNLRTWHCRVIHSSRNYIFISREKIPVLPVDFNWRRTSRRNSGCVRLSDSRWQEPRKRKIRELIRIFYENPTKAPKTKPKVGREMLMRREKLFRKSFCIMVTASSSLEEDLSRISF